MEVYIHLGSLTPSVTLLPLRVTSRNSLAPTPPDFISFHFIDLRASLSNSHNNNIHHFLSDTFSSLCFASTHTL